MEDFAVINRTKLEPLERYELKQRLSNLAQSDVDGYNIAVRDDLTLLHQQAMPAIQRFGWQIAQCSSWLKACLYRVDAKQTAHSLALIERQIVVDFHNEKELISLFEKAVAKFNTLPTHPDYQPYTLAIHRAVLARNLASVIRLVNTDNRYLLLCNSIGETPLHVALRKKMTDIVRFLINNTPNAKHLNISDAVYGYTPLHLTLLHHSRESLELLLRRYVDPTLLDHKGRSSLDIAIQQRCDVSTIQRLQEYVKERHNRYHSSR
jgi:hypothetical protein